MCFTTMKQIQGPGCLLRSFIRPSLVKWIIKTKTNQEFSWATPPTQVALQLIMLSLDLPRLHHYMIEAFHKEPQRLCWPYEYCLVCTATHSDGRHLYWWQGEGSPQNRTKSVLCISWPQKYFSAWTFQKNRKQCHPISNWQNRWQWQHWAFALLCAKWTGTNPPPRPPNEMVN